jgi:DNA-binding response OmpR family regulator
VITGLLRSRSVFHSSLIISNRTNHETAPAAGRFTSLDNVIDVHMANLRKKLRAAIGHDPIETVRGVGYRLP